MSKKIAFAFSGSFCNFKKITEALNYLSFAEDGNGKYKYDITPIFSENVQTVDTRFGKADDFILKIETLCGKKGIKTIADAESTVTKGEFDCLVVAPCTGNTLSKIARAVTDTTVTMAVKAQLRNRRPVLIGFASNDGLAGSLQNIASLLERKNIYFIPLGQDDPENKPTSLICDFDLLEVSLENAFEGRQTEPLIICGRKGDK
ncbi:MAG: dipicolinate synthase subunit B [Clostridia bacterium]|nr:dipicolinate synthase subunit B [Clostridia bacterium]